jgi:hypothetical protein
MRFNSVVKFSDYSKRASWFSRQIAVMLAFSVFFFILWEERVAS